MKRKKTAAVIAAFSTALLLAGCANAVKSGTEALESKDYETAAAEFQTAAEDEDKETAAEGYRGLGIVYYETGDYANALEAFRSALDNGAEQTAELYNLMGVSAMQTGDYESGLVYIQSGLAMADAASDGEAVDDSLIREMEFNEIVCYEQQSDWENAKEKAAEYISKYPDDEAAQKEAEFLQTR